MPSDASSSVLSPHPIPPPPMSLSPLPSPSLSSDYESNDDDYPLETDSVLPLPPEGTYVSHEAAKNAANAFAELHGYGLVFGRKNKKAKGATRPHRYILECKRHKQRQSKKSRPRTGQRFEPTVRKGCEMKMVIEVVGCKQGHTPVVNDDSQWLLLYSSSSQSPSRHQKHA